MEANKLRDEEIKLIKRQRYADRLNHCQMSKNLKKSISHPVWASRYRTWTNTDVQGTKGTIWANIAQRRLSFGCKK